MAVTKEKVYPCIAADERVIKILETIFLNEAAKIYEIEKKTGYPHATVTKKVKEALKAGLIEVKSETKFRTGLLSKSYGLTRAGFHVIVKYLPIHEETVKKLDDYAQRYPELHPALGWWQSFKKHPLLQYVFIRNMGDFEEYFPSAFLGFFTTWTKEQYEKFGGIFHIHMFFEITAQLNEEGKKELAKQIQMLIKRDKRFRNEIISKIKWWREYYKVALKDIEKIEEQVLRR
jgi:DNA-binding MarR family transcriptional regulator